MITCSVKKFLKIIFLLYVCIPLSVIAAENIGVVLAVQGSVYAQQANAAKRTLARRSPIFLKDQITSRANSYAQIKLRDDSLISIQPNTKFSVEIFKYDPKRPQESSYVGKLVTGALMNLSGQGNPSNYQVQGPLSTISFRGTGITYRVAGQKEQIGVFSGAIDVKSPKRQKQLTYTTRNYRQVVIEPDGSIQSSEGSLLFPVALPPGKVFVSSNRTGALLRTISDLIAQAKISPAT